MKCPWLQTLQLADFWIVKYFVDINIAKYHRNRPKLTLDHHQNIRPFFEQIWTKFERIFCLTELPGKPTGPIRVMDLRANKTTLAWQPPFDDGGIPLLGYNVQVSRDGGEWQRLANVEPGIRTFVVEGLKEGTPYSFRVLAENKLGASLPLVSETIIPRKRIGTISSPTSTFWGNKVNMWGLFGETK